MGKIIPFSVSRRESKLDLNTLLKRAVELRDKVVNSRDDLKKSLIIASSPAEFRIWVSGLISEAIFKHPSLISSETFLCGSYSSSVLTECLFGSPRSWWAIDYLKKFFESKDQKKRATALKKGGDLCFLICSVFPERANVRAMRLADYRNIGIGFYQRHFSFAGAEISNHMSERFSPMAAIIRDHVLANLRWVR